MFEQEQKNEDELQTSIEGIFGALFKSHSSLCGKLLETLFSDFIPVYLDKEAPFIKQKFALYVIVDVLEYLGFEI